MAAVGRVSITVEPCRFVGVPLISTATAENDYTVTCDGLRVGRIMLTLPRSLVTAKNVEAAPFNRRVPLDRDFSLCQAEARNCHRRFTMKIMGTVQCALMPSAS